MAHAAPTPPVRPAFPGAPNPLGASFHRENGRDRTRFAVHAPDADGVEVCLIAPDGSEDRIALPEQTFGVWHGEVDGVAPGQWYGYRCHGQWDPGAGIRLNPAKLLLDPWGTRVIGDVGDPVALRSFEDDPFGAPSTVDSRGHTPLSVVTTPLDPVTPSHPRVPWEDTVVYEMHVGAFTARHPDIPERERGSYLGLAHPRVLEYLTGLGVTAVELLPVHACLTEESVRARGMRNHWGYSTAGFFAPHPGYAAEPGREIAEFATMVRALHDAGLEVILDVVYNHTCEERGDGITLSWRGLDARGYYLLDEHGHDIDLTGCGNTLDASSPIVVRMIVDSLRHWAGLGVDGFRFDLASALGRRGGGEFDPRAAVFSAIAADPVLTRCKLIAEPWDATADGYRVGGFEPPWSEWNDRFRDVVREFWTGSGGVGPLASRVSGSEDLFGSPRRVHHVGHAREPWGGPRRPWASINYVTAHDGFTVADLVSYRRKHNDANREDGRDGTDHNHSVDHGVEGPTDDPDILAARARHVRALLATLLLSTGTPMLLSGDEFGNSWGGNNNAYCVPAGTARTDAWPLDWSRADVTLIAFVRRALALRRAAPALRQPEFFTGRRSRGGNPDLVWFDDTGTEMTEHSWHDGSLRTLQAWIDCADVRSHTADGHLLGDDSWLVVAHAGGPHEITLARPEWFYGTLLLEFDSSRADGAPDPRGPLQCNEILQFTGPTFLVLRAVG
ncbi:glycogen debranching protein GlgX [Rhodococcus sp. HNM0569]|uniref:glycogen debranching protein GlgX n=1 Tax=Rhodococcus sp. HNM0569 TaxID=2716340 RepID=UPI00146DECCE|nr:glycogen debranching protein GlgX [Rhodococcus sp. HNM0569]